MLMIVVTWIHLLVNLFHFSNFICIVSHLLFEFNKLDILLYDLLLLVLDQLLTSLNLLFWHMAILDKKLCVAKLEINQGLDFIKIGQFLLYKISEGNVITKNEI